jgi:thiomorpholine-carboxylate dehydrogenase
MLILDEQDVRRVLQMRELIPAMENALRQLSAGSVLQPLRTVLPVPQHAGFFGVMPARAQALGAKLVTFYPNNRGIHTHHAVIALFRPETGEPLAVIDGRLITEMRTAAVSAAATKALARTDAQVLAILGSGVQARSHLEALRLVRDFVEVRVWSPNGASAFAAEFGVQAADSAQEAVSDADVVVVATSATAPVLAGGWLKPGTHINAVGATRPNWRELDDEVLRRARIWVDSREAAANESGDVIAASKPVSELGELLAAQGGGRTSPDEITLFKSVGVAAEDIAAAELVVNKVTSGNS